jgi:hypothetical protein
LRHYSKGRECSWRHQVSGCHQSARYRQFRDAPQQASALQVGPDAIAPLHGLSAAQAFSRICSLAPSGVNDAASPYRQTALAIPYQRSALWEQHFQSLDQKLNPAVFFDRQKADNLRTCSDDDRNNSSSGGIHNRSADTLSVRLSFLPANHHLNLPNPAFKIRQSFF